MCNGVGKLLASYEASSLSISIFTNSTYPPTLFMWSLSLCQYLSIEILTHLSVRYTQIQAHTHHHHLLLLITVSGKLQDSVALFSGDAW